MEPGSLGVLTTRAMPKKIPLYKSRSLRTVFLALTATATFAGSAILIFHVKWQVMMDFLLACLAGLGIVMIVAFGLTGLKLLITRWLSKK